MKYRCIRNGILFAFLQQRTRKGTFVDQTSWGFQHGMFKDLNREGHNPLQRALKEGRWAKVLMIGPECEQVNVGDYICIEPLMHTNAFEYDGVKIHKTDESKVMLISKEKPNIFSDR